MVAVMGDTTKISPVDRRTLAKQSQAKMTAWVAEQMPITMLRMTADRLKELADEWESKAFFESQRVEFDNALSTLVWAESTLNEKLSGKD